MILSQIAKAYRNLENFKKAETMLKLALEKSEGMTDSSDTRRIRSGMTFDLVIAYVQQNKLLKASECLKGAIKDEPDVNDLCHQKLLISKNMMLAGIFNQTEYYELGKKCNELTFLAYFKIMEKDCLIHAMTLVQSLALSYFNEFNVESFKDCLDLVDNIFEKQRSNITAQEGQHAIYHETNILLSRTKYDIIQALISSSERECNKKLEQIQLTLTEGRINSLPSDAPKFVIETLLMHTQILLDGPSFDKSVTDEKLDLERTNRISLVLFNDYLINIYKKVLQLQYCSTDREKNKEKFALNNLKCEIVDFLENRATQEYKNHNLSSAKLLMRRAYLFKSIVDFLKFEVAKHVTEGVERIELKPNAVSNTKISDNDLILYIRQRCSSKSSNAKDSIIKQYEKTKHNIKLRNKLISEYKKELAAMIVAFGQNMQEDGTQLIDHISNELSIP